MRVIRLNQLTRSGGKWLGHLGNYSIYSLSQAPIELTEQQAELLRADPTQEHEFTSVQQAELKLLEEANLARVYPSAPAWSELDLIPVLIGSIRVKKSTGGSYLIEANGCEIELPEFAARTLQMIDGRQTFAQLFEQVKLQALSNETDSSAIKESLGGLGEEFDDYLGELALFELKALLEAGAIYLQASRVSF